MKIVLIVSDSWLNKPGFAEKVFSQSAKDIAFVALNPAKFKHLTWSDILYKHLILLGPVGFFLYSFLTVLFGILDVLAQHIPTVTPRSVKTVALRHNVPIDHVEDINSRAFLDKLKEIKPDIIFNLSNQIYKKEILAIPSKGCINVHGSLLPRYGGMYSAFWAMLHGEKEVGVTVHYMDEKLDAGDIIQQEAIPIKPDSTALGLMTECTDLAADLVLKAFDDIDRNKVQSRPMTGDKSYFSFPEKKDVEAFRKKGLKVWSSIY